ncbi:LysE family translocator [Polycladidibacter stylochi]|uniref:LysE family translocator n=1 Tax=Polycladidibacter stylochi TaxID=1807766 RepID=UPI0009E8337B|nr:LysE family translocator [Pseudovibrio stylochi]
MNFELIMTGFIIGLVTSAPVGPVNVMAIRRAVNRGFIPGFLAGLGAVTADALFALAAALGVTAIAEFIKSYSLAIQLCGGLLLLFYGINTLRVHLHLSQAQNSGTSIIKGFFAAFAMTVTNPGAILGFVAIFGSLGHLAPDHKDYLAALTLVTGVIIGALLWWASISMLVSKLIRHRVNDSTLDWINRIAAIILIGFGGFLLVKVAATLLGFWPADYFEAGLETLG